MQRHPPRAAADVQDPAAHELYRMPFDGRPLFKWRKIGRRTSRNAKPMIVAFDDFGR
jgi:hypothetical protein